MKKIVIAIDGYSGTGKSSTAKSVAAKLGYKYIDSGAMYRAVTYYLLKHNIALDDFPEIRGRLADIVLDFETDALNKSFILLNGQVIEHEIRKPQVSQSVSVVAAIPEVRQKLVKIQQNFGKEKGIVMDGRDIGTVVFPDAELKIFMTAKTSVRAKRRQMELDKKGIKTELSDVEDNLKDRDRKDTTRMDSPLRKAEDAFEIDTTNLTFQEQVDNIVLRAEQLISA